MALNAITSNCGIDIRDMIEGYRWAKVWITIKFRYEPANPKDNEKKSIETYVSFKSTRIYPRKPIEGGDGAAYAEQLRELYERIKQANATYIREGSGWVLAGIFEIVIKREKYDQLAGRCYRELPKYFKAKRAIINIQNTDERCFSYSLLWFLDPPRDRKHSKRSLLYTNEMFDRNHLADLPYPIAPQDVNFYEDLLQINIFVYSFSDDEDKGRHPLFTSRKEYQRRAEVL